MRVQRREETPIEKRVRHMAEEALKEFQDPEEAKNAFLKRFGANDIAEDINAKRHAKTIFMRVVEEREKTATRTRQHEIVTIPHDSEGRNLRLFDVQDGIPLATVELDESNSPRLNAYVLMLPTPATDGKAVLVRSDEGRDSHAVCFAKLVKEYPALLQDNQVAMDAMVSLLVRGRGRDRVYVGVRADTYLSPENWREKNRRAIEVLQDFGIPSGKIVVFNSPDPAISKVFMENSELHLLYPEPRSKIEEINFIEDSYHHKVGGGMILPDGTLDPGIEVYHSAGSGERFVTYSALHDMVLELDSVGDNNLAKAMAVRRLASIAGMMNSKNRGDVPELSLFGASGEGYRARFAQAYDGVRVRAGYVGGGTEMG
ncbi:MAG: hypothetical protein ABIH11_05535, partial [Candidatus Altiarchaeota archaeon]